MSQPPPPSPYGMPPAHPPSSGMSNKAKFWLGVVLAIPATIRGPVIVGVAVNIGQAISADGSLSGILGALASLLLLAAFITMAFFDRTRWIALGMLAGAAVLLILAAGACVLLIVGLSNSYS